MAMDLPEPELLDAVDPTAASSLAAAAAKSAHGIYLLLRAIDSIFSTLALGTPK